MNDLKEKVYEANMAIPRYRLAQLTWGNVSARDPATGIVAIKPSGVDYTDLRPEQIVLVDPEGGVVGGGLRPSSDTPTHLELYNAFPQLGSIVHTHSTCAVAWAQALKAIPIFGTTHADQTVHDIPCSPPLEEIYTTGNYEVETGRQILRYLAELGLTPLEIEMILVGGHGPFVWGSSIDAALHNAIALEEIAHMALLTVAIDPAAERLAPQLRKKHYERKHGSGAYYGQQKRG